MKWKGTGVIAMACLVIAAACTPLHAVKPEAVNTFALETRLERNRITPKSTAQVVLVTPMRARPGFDTRRMAYVRKPHELEYFTKNQWVDAPARMLTPLLAQALESSGAYRAVLVSQGGATADLRLDSEVVRLQQEFLTDSSQVRLVLRVQLIDIEARKVLATQEFEASEDAPGNDPYAGVVAANQAVFRVLQEVAKFSITQAKIEQP